MAPNCNLRLSDLTLSIVINPLISENLVEVSKTPKQKVSQNMDIDLTCTPGSLNRKKVSVSRHNKFNNTVSPRWLKSAFSGNNILVHGKL